MLVSSGLCLIASFVLAVDAFKLASNPNAVFSCDINALVSCGKIARSWQAQVFGFPNAFLGLLFEPVVIFIAVAALSGVVFPRWIMRAAQLVYTLALVLAWWLFTQSYFVIKAFCPWCLLITVATTTVFASMTRVNILERNLPVSEKVQASLERMLRAWVDHFLVVILVLTIFAMIIFRYII